MSGKRLRANDGGGETKDTTTTPDAGAASAREAQGAARAAGGGGDALFVLEILSDDSSDEGGGSSAQQATTVAEPATHPQGEHDSASNPDVKREPDEEEVTSGVKAFRSIRTHDEHRKKRHKAKPRKTGWHVAMSRKRVDQAKRVPIRDGKRVYHAHNVQARYVRDLLANKTFARRLEAVKKTRPDFRLLVTEEPLPTATEVSTPAMTPVSRPKAPSASVTVPGAGHQPVPAPVLVQDPMSPAIAPAPSPVSTPELPPVTVPPIAPVFAPAQQAGPVPVSWPSDVERISTCINQIGVKFRDVGDLGKCAFLHNCYPDECDNATGSSFCTPGTCNLIARCSNAVRTHPGLQLYQSQNGLGVYSTTTLYVGDIVDEYCGVYRALDGVVSGQQPGELNHNSGYSMLLHKRSTTGKFVYVDPRSYGSIARFVNHACRPNAAYVEMHSRKKVKIVLMMLKTVRSGEEITADYGNERWFACNCKNCSCKRRKLE